VTSPVVVLEKKLKMFSPINGKACNLDINSLQKEEHCGKSGDWA
jgi:hypothetical protein